MLMLATIPKRLEAFFVGWESIRTFGNAVTRTAATSAAFDGSSSEPSVG